MADSQTEATIPNGEEIVERFGGIRPMAAKLDVPVTTVQGWKKRDAIPVSRRDEIINAASQYNINLRGLLADAPVANQNARIEEDPALRAAAAGAAPAPRPTASRPAQEDIDLAAIRRSARRTSLVTSTSLVVLLGVAGFALFGGDLTHQDAQINSLNNRVSMLEAQAPAPSGLPAGLDATLNDLQGKVQALSSAVGGADLPANAPTLVQRLTTLEQEIAGNPSLQGAVQQMQSMASSPNAGNWESAVSELRGIVANLQGRMDGLESALQQVKTQNDALGQTLSSVTGRDLSAAAMLLALTQLREAVDRQTPFANDLALLRDVAQSADPELAASVDKLAPYAQSGVLSPTGLKKELSDMSTDIITAKLKGENVSLKDRILARLQNLFTLKKDGVPVTGGEERELIAKAQQQLDTNDVAGALATLQQLQGPAAEAAQPWEQQAQATLAVQNIDQELVNSLVGKIRAMGTTSVTGVNAGPINLNAPQQPMPQPPIQVMPAPTQPQPQAMPDAAAPAQPSVIIQQ
jgi:hypothetical protein